MQRNSTDAMITVFFVIAIVLAIAWFLLFVWGSIFKKAGYSFWMGLLMFVPLANLIWLLIFAFSTWPIEVELEQARSDRGTGGFPVNPIPPNQT